MALKPPAWAPDAVPTTRGWARGNEILVARKISQAEIDEFFAPAVTETKKRTTRKKSVVLHEAPVGNKDVDDMTEEQQDALNEVIGNRGDYLTE